MMDVSTAHSGSLRPNANAITSAPIAATVTRTPRPSWTFRERSQAAAVLKKEIMAVSPEYRDRLAKRRALERGTFRNSNSMLAKPARFSLGFTQLRTEANR